MNQTKGLATTMACVETEFAQTLRAEGAAEDINATSSLTWAIYVVSFVGKGCCMDDERCKFKHEADEEQRYEEQARRREAQTRDEEQQDDPNPMTGRCRQTRVHGVNDERYWQQDLAELERLAEKQSKHDLMHKDQEAKMEQAEQADNKEIRMQNLAKLVKTEVRVEL